MAEGEEGVDVGYAGGDTGKRFVMGGGGEGGVNRSDIVQSNNVAALEVIDWKGGVFHRSYCMARGMQHFTQKTNSWEKAGGGRRTR